MTASFALPLEGSGREGMAAGVLWMAFLFAGLLGLGRSMAIEDEEGCLAGLLVSPAPREGIFLGKLASNLAFTAVVEALIVPLFIVLLQLHVGAPALLVVSIVLGTLGILTIGTLFAAIAIGTRGREAILPAARAAGVGPDRDRRPSRRQRPRSWGLGVVDRDGCS